MAEEYPIRTAENCDTICLPIPDRLDEWIVPLEEWGTSAMVYPDTTFGDDYMTRAREEFFATEIAQDVAEVLWEQLSAIQVQTAPSYQSGIGTDADPLPGGGEGGGSGGSGGGGGGGAEAAKAALKSGVAKLSASQLSEFVTAASQIAGIAQHLMGAKGLDALAEAVAQALAPLLMPGGFFVGAVSFEQLLMTVASTLIAALESMLAAFETKNPPTAQGNSAGSVNGGPGAPELIVETEPENKALEFYNELEFFYQELTVDKPSPESPYVEPEFWVPLFFDGGGSLMDFDVPFTEALSRMLHTYDGYMGGAAVTHFPVGAPQVSKPGEYSFMDDIDQDLKKVKRRALKSMTEAKLLLMVVPWLFTTNPNRAREANRRARHLKRVLFQAIAFIPSMLDLWDGLGEWTTPYRTLNELDKSQLKIEMWGDYLGGTPKHPQLVRDSVYRKHFSEDRQAIQHTYDTTNNFMQYCMSNTWNWAEKVEQAKWNEITEYYKTKNMKWVGERVKADMFYHLVIQDSANPYPIALACIGLSKYLIEYIVHQTEVTKIKTYDLTGLEDLRHLSFHDYRGYKRVVPFTRLDRSGLDVISDE